MSPLPNLARTAESHFRLHLYGALLHLRTRLPLEEVEFLRAYHAELDAAGYDARGDPASWWREIGQWERGAAGHLPLRALRDAAGLGPVALSVLFVAGLPDEDPRLGLLFAALEVAAAGGRPVAGLIAPWWGEPALFRTALRRLVRLGLIEATNPDAPQAEWALRAAPAIWDAARGERLDQPTPWARYRPPEQLVGRGEAILAPTAERAVDALPGLLEAGRPQPLIVRGPRRSGRRTAIGVLARALGRGVLEITDPACLGGVAGPLATALDAVPVIALEPGPGETVEVPALQAYAGPVGVVLGCRGGVAGAGVDGALVLELGMPDAAERARHWRAALAAEPAHELVDGFRATGGTIRRVAELARAQAALAGRGEVLARDVRRAARTLEGQTLETRTVRIEATGSWDDLASGDETWRELRLLESRCRHREHLGSAAGGVGVRALFSGPSGTGKTLAARLLAAALEKDLYSLDLSLVVDKYLGETEKHLEGVFARAEDLDVVLLLDEGDALLTARTDVETANDRYANLQTNFLLQRIESFAGILVVTTNAGERIDAAFRRRIDVIVDFKAPDAAERWRIWQLHLPAGHAIEDLFLDDVAVRCAITGGQIRNAVLHATLLALDEDAPVQARHVEEAVRREYRKAGAVCPLREALHA
jgi:AAA+ superfamily predicted ATPase